MYVLTWRLISSWYTNIGSSIIYPVCYILVCHSPLGANKQRGTLATNVFM